MTYKIIIGILNKLKLNQSNPYELGYIVHYILLPRNDTHFPLKKGSSRYIVISPTFNSFITRAFSFPDTFSCVTSVQQVKPRSTPIVFITSHNTEYRISLCQRIINSCDFSFFFCQIVINRKYQFQLVSYSIFNRMGEERFSGKLKQKPGILRLDISKPRRSSGGSVEFRSQPELLGEVMMSLYIYQPQPINMQKSSILGIFDKIEQVIEIDLIYIAPFCMQKQKQKSSVNSKIL